MLTSLKNPWPQNIIFIGKADYPSYICFNFTSSKSRDLFSEIIKFDFNELKLTSIDDEKAYELDVDFKTCENPAKIYKKFLPFLQALPKAKDEINSPKESYNLIEGKVKQILALESENAKKQ